MECAQNRMCPFLKCTQNGIFLCWNVLKTEFSFLECSLFGMYSNGMFPFSNGLKMEQALFWKVLYWNVCFFEMCSLWIMPFFSGVLYFSYTKG